MKRTSVETYYCPGCGAEFRFRELEDCPRERISACCERRLVTELSSRGEDMDVSLDGAQNEKPTNHRSG